MKVGRMWWIAAAALALFSAALAGQTSRPAVLEKGQTLSDREFWRLSSEFSEPDGTFHSENLVSNEALFQRSVPQLVKAVVPGRTYLGVGSEQNFTYIVATKPSFAFIVDIRRGNLDLHLLYKALFELSADRAEFVSRLFSRPRPAGLTINSSAAEMFAAYEKAQPSRSLYAANLKVVLSHLQTRHGFTLSEGDRSGIDYAYSAWFDDGPDIRYRLTTGGGGGFGRARGGRGVGGPTYADLMTATDDAGQPRSYLATEASFKLMKDLETRNLIVPVVGNFGGPKALRAVGAYLKQRGMVVSTFYVSNVEQYLRQDGLWDKFCASAATLPIDNTSTFIRSERGGFGGQRGGGPGFQLSLASMSQDLAVCKGR